MEFLLTLTAMIMAIKTVVYQAEVSLAMLVGCTVPAILIVIITVVLRKKRTAPRQINCPVRQPAAVPQPSSIAPSSVTMQPTNFRDAPPSYEAAVGGPQPSAPPFNPYHR